MALFGMRTKFSFYSPVYTQLMRKTNSFCTFGPRRLSCCISLAIVKPSKAERVHSSFLHTGSAVLYSKNDGKKTSSSSQESVFKQITKRKEEQNQLSLPGKGKERYPSTVHTQNKIFDVSKL